MESFPNPGQMTTGVWEMGVVGGLLEGEVVGGLGVRKAVVLVVRERERRRTNGTVTVK